MGRLISTIALLVVLLGLVGYIYYGGSGTDSASEKKEKVFGTVSADDIEEVQIKSADGETSRVQKADGTWRLVEPVQVAADSSELSSITSSLATLDIQRVVDESASDLKQYGLEPARLEIGFRTKGQKDSRRVLIGEKTPTGGDLYARLPDQKKVFLVSSFLDTTFNKDTLALRDKAILKFDREKVDRMELTSGSTSIQLAKSGMDWRIVMPISARADYGATEGALERLSSAQMQGIVAEDGGDLKKYGLDKPSVTMTVVAGSSRATLLLGNTDNALVFAKDSSRPMVFTVAPTLKDDVVRSVPEYRRKDLFDGRSFTINRAEFRRGAETIVLEKTKDKDGKEVWRNAGKNVDFIKAEDVLTKISGLRAQSYEAEAPAALKTPALVVTTTFDNKKMETVNFARAGTDVFASRSDEPGTAKLEGSGFDEAMKAIDAIK